MKCFLKQAVVLVFAAIFGCNTLNAQDVVASGSCGSGLIWELTSDSVFTITGSGRMTDYYLEDAKPWYQHRALIKKIVFSDGITKIGRHAFSYCPNLKNVTVPDNVTQIGEVAFEYTGLETAVIGDGVSILENFVFFNCRSLRHVTLGSSIFRLRFSVFGYCTALETVVSKPEEAPAFESTGSDANPFSNGVPVDDVIVYVCGADAQFDYKASHWGNTFTLSNIINDCDPPSGIKENILGNTIIYPNPVSSHFTVDYEGAGKVVVFDMSGKEILTQTVNGKTDVAVHYLPAGVYMVRLYANAKAIGSAKIIKK